MNFPPITRTENDLARVDIERVALITPDNEPTLEFTGFLEKVFGRSDGIELKDVDLVKLEDELSRTSLDARAVQDFVKEVSDRKAADEVAGIR